MAFGTLHIETALLAADMEVFGPRYRLSPGNANYDICAALLAEAAALAQPKAAWRSLSVAGLDEDGMILAGRRFTSPLFHQYLREGQEVAPFIATCGRELAVWSRQYQADYLRNYWAGAIMEYAAEQARELLCRCLRGQAEPQLSEFSPGSLPQFPLSEQLPLFQVLGEGPQGIGVTLTDAYLMKPLKSVSGIIFWGGQPFHSCQLCPRPNCPKRRAGLLP